jgi:hypothetical protein
MANAPITIKFDALGFDKLIDLLPKPVFAPTFTGMYQKASWIVPATKAITFEIAGRMIVLAPSLGGSGYLAFVALPGWPVDPKWPGEDGMKVCANLSDTGAAGLFIQRPVKAWLCLNADASRTFEEQAARSAASTAARFVTMLPLSAWKETADTEAPILGRRRIRVDK